MCAKSTISIVTVIFELGQKEPSDIIFSDGRSVKACFREVKKNVNGYCVFTDLIVYPKRHKNTRRYSHTRIDETSSGKTFVAIIERDEFVAACKRADQVWHREIEKVGARIGQYRKPNSKPSINELPREIKGRIKIDKSGCWLWKQARSGRIRKKEYGIISYHGQRWPAHRLVYILLLGGFPEQAFLMHQCDTPACVNPGHLIPASPRQNFEDMVSKRRATWQK